jgi:molecular chaperone DnaJ
MRLTGRGAAGPRGGDNGDLYVHVAVALGVHQVLEALDGDLDLVVPAGTQHGHEFVAKGRGVTHLNGRGRGHLRVRVSVVIPSHLDEEQESLYRRLAEISGDEVASADKGIFSRIKSAFS